MQSKIVMWSALAILAFAACSSEPDVPEQTNIPTAPTKSLGAKLFVQCRACHTVDKAGENGVGPNLHNVVGAKAAAKSGYVYSPALTQSGLIWTPENLDRFLAKPNAVTPGTKMAFTGIASADVRRELIAYLEAQAGE